MLYEQRKHDGSLPIVGVNTFLPAEGGEPPVVELRRSDDAEKQDQLRRVAEFRAEHSGDRERELDRLRNAVLGGGNVFEVLMSTVRHCTLGEISEALYDVGGRYRRNV